MPTITSVTIDGAALRRLRVMHRFSREALAAEAGISASNLVRLEIREHKTSLVSLDRLAQVFGRHEVAALIPDADERAMFLGPPE